jgi:hypothetical protein
LQRLSPGVIKVPDTDPPPALVPFELEKLLDFHFASA